MKAEEIMAGIRSLEPREFEKLLALIQDYVAEIHAGSRGPNPKETGKGAAGLVVEIDGALARLADMERRERDSQSNME